MRLIDLDALPKVVLINGNSDEVVDAVNTFLKMLREAPTIEAEPIIRCKDCFFCGEIDENGWHWCQCTGAGMPKDGFCSYAERKGWNWGQ